MDAMQHDPAPPSGQERRSVDRGDEYAVAAVPPSLPFR